MSFEGVVAAYLHTFLHRVVAKRHHLIPIPGLSGKKSKC